MNGEAGRRGDRKEDFGFFGIPFRASRHPRILPLISSPPRLVCPSEVKLTLRVRQPDPVLVLKTVGEQGAAHVDQSVPSPNRCPSRRARIVRKDGPRRRGRNQRGDRPCSWASTFQRSRW